jgi:hypothetical protein
LYSNVQGQGGGGSQRAADKVLDDVEIKERFKKEQAAKRKRPPGPINMQKDRKKNKTSDQNHVTARAKGECRG